jgi:hypothetical protein
LAGAVAVAAVVNLGRLLMAKPAVSHCGAVAVAVVAEVVTPPTHLEAQEGLVSLVVLAVLLAQQVAPELLVARAAVVAVVVTTG